MPKQFLDGAGNTKYAEGVGTGDSTGDPYRGTSLLVGGALVTSGNPVPTADAAVETAVDAVATAIGATNETAAASDTATSGLNGLFKRFLQRFTLLYDNILTRPIGTTAAPVVARGEVPVVFTGPITLTAASAYAQNTSLGGLYEWTNAVPAAGRGLLLQSAQLTIRPASASPVITVNPALIRCTIFNAHPASSTTTNLSTINVVPADDDKLELAFFFDAGHVIDGSTTTASQGSSSGLPQLLTPASGTSLWVMLHQTSASSLTFTGTADIKIKLKGVPV